MADGGVTVIDTADSYASGDCEILLGKALRRNEGKFKVVTKAGYRLSNLPGPLRPLNQFIKKALHRLGERQRFDPCYLRRSLEQSLSRLGREQVDVFLLHDPPIGVMESEGVQKVCEQLRDSGKAAQTGVSSLNPEVLQRALESELFTVIETPANLAVAHSLRPIWKGCEGMGVRLIANHVYAPACLRLPGMSHETLMRASSSLVPPDATILCGTRNPLHLQLSNDWAQHPMPPADAWQLAGRYFPQGRP